MKRLANFTSLFIGIVRDILNQFRADVLKFVFQFNAFGHGDTIFGDLWCTPALLKNNIATLNESIRYDGCRFTSDLPHLRTHSHSDGIGKNVHALQHQHSRLGSEFDLLGQ